MILIVISRDSFNPKHKLAVALESSVPLQNFPSSTTLSRQNPKPATHHRLHPFTRIIATTTTRESLSRPQATSLTVTRSISTNQRPWPTKAMAKKSSSSSSSRSSNYYASSITESARANILASCYAVDASSTALQGFHYSSTGAGGVDWRS